MESTNNICTNNDQIRKLEFKFFTLFFFFIYFSFFQHLSYNLREKPFYIHLCMQSCVLILTRQTEGRGVRWTLSGARSLRWVGGPGNA